MKKNIRVGILGLGRIGKMHAKNIATMKEFEIVRGVDHSAVLQGAGGRFLRPGH